MAGIDWQYWQRAERARLFEVVALVAGIDPSDFTTSLSGPTPPAEATSEQQDTYARVLDLARAQLSDYPGELDQDGGGLSGLDDLTNVGVEAFLAWARQLAISVPSQFVRGDTFMSAQDSIDWQVWGRIDSARLFELAALCAGVAPERVVCVRAGRGFAAGQRASVPPGIHSVAFTRMLALLRSAVESRALAHGASWLPIGACDGVPISVDAFIRWADVKRLDLPSELRSLRVPSSAELKGWKAILDAYARLTGKTTSERSLRRQFEASGIQLEGNPVTLSHEVLEGFVRRSDRRNPAVAE